MLNKIFFPGSFNPFTAGHADILERLLKLSEKVTVGVGVNADKPASAKDADRNAETIREYVRRKGLDRRVDVVVYSGLTAREAQLHGADCMARGVRSASDFEYEYSLAAANRDAFGMETILLPSSPSLSYISSSLLRDLINNDRTDIATKYLPE